MKDYLCITGVAAALAARLLLQQVYQRKAGDSPEMSLMFSALDGLTIAVLFLFVKRFHLTFAPFSILMALCSCLLTVSYTMLGFRILKAGSVAYYSMFLMAGGMTVPYIWGLLFLDEPIRILRIVGLILITAAVFYSNAGGQKLQRNQLLMCVGVFVLNGFTSVVVKMHQINTVYRTVDATEFVFLSGVLMCLSSTLILAGKRLWQDHKGVRREIPPIHRLYPFIFAMAILESASSMGLLLSAENLPASVIFPFSTGGTIVLSALGGMLFLHEAIGWRRWVCVAVCLAGTCMFL